jgi:hypothetical protein
VKKKIIIPYFPKGLTYMTPILAGVAIWLIIISYPIWGSLLIVLAFVILTTKYVTEINLNSKSYQDYLFLLGLKLNVEENRFKQLDRIVITKGNYAQTVNTRVQSRQMEWADYTATLLMDDNLTLDLVTRTDKQELMKGLKEFSDFLQVEVEDQTTGKHYFVDMNKV